LITFEREINAYSFYSRYTKIYILRDQSLRPFKTRDRIFVLRTLHVSSVFVHDLIFNSFHNP